MSRVSWSVTRLTLETWTLISVPTVDQVLQRCSNSRYSTALMAGEWLRLTILPQRLSYFVVFSFLSITACFAQDHWIVRHAPQVPLLHEALDHTHDPALYTMDSAEGASERLARSFSRRPSVESSCICRSRSRRYMLLNTDSVFLWVLWYKSRILWIRVPPYNILLGAARSEVCWDIKFLINLTAGFDRYVAITDGFMESRTGSKIKQPGPGLSTLNRTVWLLNL